MRARRGVYLLTLGCPKNEADSGALARSLRGSGVELASAPERASHIVVNTCGFIESAREESIGAVLEAGADHPEARLLVMGCLVERYRDELAAGIPEVDGWFGLSEVDALTERLARETRGRPGPGGAKRTVEGRSAERESRETAAASYAYVKISDGCDHRCTFCAIPAIKGPYVAEPVGRILEQARAALSEGARELVLVGQDTAVWREGDLDLLGLVDLLAEDGRVRRIRLLYLQPEHVDQRLLEHMAGHRTLCRYLDIPFQHAGAAVLRRMGRRGDGDEYLGLLERARREMPDVSLRSTFIVGFPGETEADVDRLVEFVTEARLDHAGVFAFSPEEGTRAAGLDGRLAPSVVEERLRRVGQALVDVGEEAALRRVGSVVEVLVDEVTDHGPAGTWGVGRTCGQAPEVDGVAFLAGGRSAGVRPGDLLSGVVEEAAGYDLVVDVRLDGERAE